MLGVPAGALRRNINIFSKEIGLFFLVCFLPPMFFHSSFSSFLILKMLVLERPLSGFRRLPTFNNLFCCS